MNKNVLKRFVQVVVTFIIEGALLFVSAWTLHWLWAWVFIALCIIILIINLFALPVEVIEERGRKKENVKKWDRVLTTISILPILGTFAISGLDHRFGWSIDFNMLVNITGLVLFFLGSMLFSWAMKSNRYFSTMVRLQNDRGQTVATTGPYKHVRHPGYVGFILFSLATPVALGSLYGLITAGITSIIIIIRTYLEDKTLRNELPGYADYTKKVKYRLLPHIW